eukprot:scaffold60068_cov60-Phaeocystis_antarctica.AAC.2
MRAFRIQQWGSLIGDSKIGWLPRLPSWGATGDFKQEAGAKLKPEARAQLNPHSVCLRASPPYSRWLGPK